jgi:tetratricopeptide (TPR) repeat protein
LRQSLVFSAFSVLVAVSCFGQSLQDAQALLTAKKYSEAATAFQRLISADNNNGAAWMGLGQAMESQKQTEKAVAAYEKAIALKASPKMAMFNIARTYAAAEEQAKSYEWLTTLAESGAPGFILAYLNGSSEFDSMKSQARFKQIQEKLKSCNAPEYHQFDFWLGSWEVHNPQGQRVGHNDVVRTINECIIQENWASGRGVERGTSFNFYDNRDKKWHQIYFDNSGNMGNYPQMSGGFKDGRMVMTTDPAQSPLSRWSFYPLDTSGKKVRQWAEQSTDGGKTWTTTWDSVYVKE